MYFRLANTESRIEGDATQQRLELYSGVQRNDEYRNRTTVQRLLLIYAWNENGDGRCLTPTAKEGTECLKAVQRAIRGERRARFFQKGENSPSFGATRQKTAGSNRS
jgi:hypothetical protein